MKVPFRRDRRTPPPAVPEGAVRVGPLADVPEGAVQRICQNPPIAVLRHGATVHAFEDRCPHAGALLSRGTARGDEVTCPSHKGVFRADTGKSIGEQSCRALRTYEPVVVDGVLYVNPAPREAREARRDVCDRISA
ncbi:Rieske (2Fe-2S) protein [Yinghuangia seranimata]|uniref:Rieske (2Fe-2S) protein n=1 Tax=Yinghuangia seranimata TaxID=408067 RepID=UPI00248B09B4|nr:Rieske 2Fe-2S domain-containing protein [Yinghuangia seranimata]MDI2130349.1 Rieske 2Fe-2S domain-containing protein [Yinghuangia seranimata]